MESQLDIVQLMVLGVLQIVVDELIYGLALIGKKVEGKPDSTPLYVPHVSQLPVFCIFACVKM